MHFPSNLKILRKRTKKKQAETAEALGMTRSSYSGYENCVASPSIDGLITISKFYNIQIDDLVKKDLRTFTEAQFSALDNDLLIDLAGDKIRILTSVVDSDNNEQIEMVPLKASAGYSSGYSDPEYIKVLPTFHLPFLSKNKKYRSFPIKGDSMPPVNEGSYVTAEFLQNWETIKDGTPCIVVTKDEGIVFKIVHNLIQTKHAIQLCSTNLMYSPYMVQVKDILEVWKFVNYISPELPDVRVDDSTLSEQLRMVQKEIYDIKMEVTAKN